jgi:WD40 repeat protein
VAPSARWSRLHSDRHLASLDITTVPFTQTVRVTNPKTQASHLETHEHSALGVSSSGREGEVCLWNADSGELIRRFEGHCGGVHTSKYAFPEGRAGIYLNSICDGYIFIFLEFRLLFMIFVEMCFE